MPHVPTLLRAAAPLAAVLALLLAPADARAHAVGAEVKLADGVLRVEAYFDDDTPADAAAVSVLDAGGKPVAGGKTDAAGKWSCPAPPPGRYTVTIDAGAGHRAKAELTVPEATPAPQTVSDGPTREEFTGPLRFVWAGVGLLAIGGGTWLATRLLRGRRSGGADQA